MVVVFVKINYKFGYAIQKKSYIGMQQSNNIKIDYR